MGNCKGCPDCLVPAEPRRNDTELLDRCNLPRRFALASSGAATYCCWAMAAKERILEQDAPSRYRWAIRLSFIAALIVAAVAAITLFETFRDCRGGPFNAGFSPGFYIKRCFRVIRHIQSGQEIRWQISPNDETPPFH